MKIALVENFGADFVGARIRYALFLKEKGIDVTAIVPQDGNKEKILKEGIKVIEVSSNIRGAGIKNKISYARDLRRILKKESFDIVHFYRLQPNIIGSFVAGISTKSKIVNHVTGLGVAFTDNSLKHLLLKNIIRFCYKFTHFFFNTFIIYQNGHDVFDLKIDKRTACVKGSAVNESIFNKNCLSKEVNEINILKEKLGITRKDGKVILFVSRLLKQKGINELIKGFVEAQKDMRKPIYLLLVGWSDLENPDCVSIDELKEKIKSNEYIKFLGKRSDVDKLISLSDICVLPTYYREGTPRFLLESMAMGKPIITTNVPGCDHLIPEGLNGELIEPRSSEEIRKSLFAVMSRDFNEMGNKSYDLYKSKFSEQQVYPAILKIYESI